MKTTQPIIIQPVRCFAAKFCCFYCRTKKKIFEVVDYSLYTLTWKIILQFEVKDAQALQDLLVSFSWA